jgi:hypothetical protein
MLEKDVGGGYWLKECVEVNVGWRMFDGICWRRMLDGGCWMEDVGGGC